MARLNKTSAKNNTSVETAFPITSPVEEQGLPPVAIDSALSPEEYIGNKKKLKVIEEEVPSTIDRVNNINQKEESLYRAGVTRRKVYERIGELLNAKKRVVGYDSRGMEVVSEEPDLGRRKEGAELAMRAFGDSKEFLAVNTQVNNVMDVKAIVEAIKANGK